MRELHRYEAMVLAACLMLASFPALPPEPRTELIRRVLKDAASKGLDPADYEGPVFTAALRYASDLRFGKLNRRRQCELANWVNQTVAGTDDPAVAFEQLEPPFPGYWQTLGALSTYSQLLQNDSGEKLPSTPKPVEPGQYYSGVPQLALLLRKLGDLPPDGLAPGQIYSGALVEAVKRFQARHGLDADGRLGANTLRVLNTPLQQRIRQLRLTLERWREVPHEFARPPIVVNIPEFRLHALGDDYRTELAMKIVAGKAGRLATPVFIAEMKSVIFRPYWNVPFSIQKNELVPKIERDRGYLASNDYELVTSGGEVVRNGIVSDDLIGQLRAGHLQIRQSPGAKNALGAVKFVLPNEKGIYLHDTPARTLFSRSRRDFSHGCIRLESAADLAVWVLRDRPEWTRNRIDDAMRGSRTLQVELKHPIPVLVVYGTAVVQEDGIVSFFDDIYGLDAALDRELARIR